MMIYQEIIIDIKAEESFSDEDEWSSYDGFIITTNLQTIKLGISNWQNCCENWGYFMSEDNLKDFIGAGLIDLKVVDTALKVHEELEDLYEGDAMFVNIETTAGTLQFVAYNEHNGYYGHQAVVISKQLNEECTI